MLLISVKVCQTHTHKTKGAFEGAGGAIQGHESLLVKMEALHRLSVACMTPSWSHYGSSWSLNSLIDLYIYGFDRLNPEIIPFLQ